MTPLLLTATETAGALGGTGLLILAALAFLGWRLTLIVLFPFAPHRPCKGSGKRFNGRNFRPCRGCKGTGRTLRLGRRVWNWTRNEVNR